MPKFRKKPVVIEAMQWTGVNLQEMLKWFAHVSSAEDPAKLASEDGAAELVVEMEVAKCKVTFDMTKKPTIKLLIQTLEGTMEAEHGDWIICGVRSELYPCKDSIFKETYEPA